MPKKPKSTKAKTRKGICYSKNIVRKEKKDKNAPKRPMSAFFCYQKVRRPMLAKENPKLGNKQIVSVHLLFNTSVENVRGVEGLE